MPLVSWEHGTPLPKWCLNEPCLAHHLAVWFERRIWKEFIIQFLNSTFHSVWIVKAFIIHYRLHDLHLLLEAPPHGHVERQGVRRVGLLQEREMPT